MNLYIINGRVFLEAQVTKDGDGNLVYPVLAAVESYATIGEICATLETEFGTYRPPEVL